MATLPPGNGNGRAARTLPHIEAPRGEQEVVLRGLEVEVVVNGLHAETTQTMVFHNPNRRDLEGSLVFPLPDGAAVCGYALDVGGRMVDGVVVPKREARRILEAEVRKGIDPGLVEQVQGNVYRTRVYPLPAGGTRTVRIAYTGGLAVDGNGAALSLPLPHAGEVDRVHLRVEVARGPVDPVLEGGPGNLRLQEWEGRQVAEAVLDRQAPREDLLLRLPDLPDRFVAVESTAEGEVFFCVSARVPEAAGEERAPARVAVAWDASGSRTAVDRELALLRDLARRWPAAKADLVVFRNRVEEPLSFEGLAGLADHVEGLVPDGSTGLALLDLSTVPHPDAEAWLLFTDGLDALNRGLPKFGPVPISALTSQAQAHGALLRHLAEATGGTHLDLLRIDPGRAGERLARRRDPARAPAVEGCTDLQVVRSPGRLQVLGRLLLERGSVTFPGEAPLTLESREASPGRTLARAWAGHQAASLEIRGAGEGAMAALGRRYGLVTPGTSLLVLESLEQYLEYDLEPPDSLPEVRERFLRLRTEREESAGHVLREHMERVLALWEQRVRWWETDFRPAWDGLRAGRKEGEKRRHAARPALLRSRGVVEEVELAAAFPDEALEEECGAEPPMELEAGPEDMMYCLAPEAEAPSGACPPAPSEAMLCKEAAPEEPAAPTIRIQPWVPDTPYLRALRAEESRPYEAYLLERPDYAGSPSFFLDCGDHLLTRDLRDLGLRVLSNLLELGLEDPPLMRMYAWRLQQAGELDEAVEVLERVLALRPDEPQSHRDLGLALGDRWERDGDPADAARAVTLLYEVVQRRWERFPEIEIIALVELNRLLARAEEAGVQVPAVDPRLRRLLDLDVRISMSWDADLTDVDLHVFEPPGEHAYYGHQRTEIGGLVSRDFRDGYGPEEYVLRRAFPGTYTIKAHYYGSHQQTLTGSCTVVVQVFTDYGRPAEARQTLTLRLDQPSSEALVGEVILGEPAAGGAPPAPPGSSGRG